MIKYIVIIVLLLFLNGCERKASIMPSGKSIEIAIIASQSGEQNAFGVQGLQGLNAAKALKPLLPNGDEIVFKIYDDNSSSAKAKKLIESLDYNTTALITFSGSDLQLSIAKLIQELKFPTLAAIATDDDFVKMSSYMTRLSMSNSIEAQVSASYIRDEMLLTRVGVVYSENNTYSKSIAEFFKSSFGSISGKVVEMISIEELGKSIQSYQKTLDKLKLDLIFFTTDAQRSYYFLKYFHKLKSDVRLFGTDGLLSDMQKHYPKELDLLNGVLIVDHYSDDMYKNKLTEDLEEYFKKKNLQLSSFAGLGYESYQLMYATLKKCSDYSRECVNDALRNSEVIEGIVSIMQTTDGVMQRPIYINEIRNNKMYRKVKVY